MEKLEISCAYNLGVFGFEIISKMKNLTSLELSFACMDDGDGEDTGLRSTHLIKLFDNKNMEFLGMNFISTQIVCKTIQQGQRCQNLKIVGATNKIYICIYFYINFLEKLSLAGSDLMDCCYPRRDRKGDIGNVDDMVIKTIALNCPRLKYIDLYKGK